MEDADGFAGIDPTSSLSRLFIDAVTSLKLADLAAGGTGKNRGGRPRGGKRDEQPTPRREKAEAVAPVVPFTPRAEPEKTDETPTPAPAVAPAPRQTKATYYHAGGADRVEAKSDEIALKNKLLKTKLQRERAAVWKNARTTVSASAARSIIGRISSAIEEQFRSFADRHADALVAMSAAGAGRLEIADYLETEIGKSMATVILQCKRVAESVADEKNDGLD
jgi:hypothetical protein